jgi:hypothetical protein
MLCSSNGSGGGNDRRLMLVLSRAKEYRAHNRDAVQGQPDTCGACRPSERVGIVRVAFRRRRTDGRNPAVHNYSPQKKLERIQIKANDLEAHPKDKILQFLIFVVASICAFYILSMRISNALLGARRRLGKEQLVRPAPRSPQPLPHRLHRARPTRS